VIQANPGAWEHDAPRNINGVLGLQHIGVAVKGLQATIRQFAELLDLQASELRTDQHGGEQKDIMICPGNDRLWLHVTQSWGQNARVRHYLERVGEGLEHLCIEVDDIRHAVNRVTGMGVPLFDDKIFTNRPDGFEAFIYPEYTSGVTIELIEPYPTSRGYRPRRP
jgi:catechol 2,3-dioxygenase-like lactoylglutathione lyase family enzyme